MQRLLKLTFVLVLGVFICSCGLIPDVNSLLPDTSNGVLSLSFSPSYLTPNGSSGTLTVSLTGDNETLKDTANGQVIVSFASSESSLVSFSPSCIININVSSGSCSIQVTPGSSLGYTIITASAPNVQSVGVGVSVDRATYAYISDTNASTIFTCPVVGESADINISTSACLTNNNSGIPEGISPYPIAINQQQGGRPYAYVPTKSASGYGDLYVCNIASNFALSSCEVSNGGLDSQTLAASSVSFATQNNVTSAYIVSAYTDKMYVCGVNSDGSLTSCTQLSPTPGVQTPISINFDTNAKGVTNAYVLSESANKIYQCQFKAESNVFSQCLTTANVGLESANSMVFKQEESSRIFYVSSPSGVEYCSFIDDSGTISECTKTPQKDIPSWSPVSLAYHKAADTFSYVYVMTGNNIWKCSAFIKNLFGLSDCKLEDQSGLNINPTGITFYDVK